MKRKMTERAAWLLLAGAWDKAENIGGTFKAMVVNFYGSGVCVSLASLTDANLLAMVTRNRMIDKLPDYVGGYAWPQDAAGAKQRAAFCRAQAAKCAKRKPVKA